MAKQSLQVVLSKHQLILALTLSSVCPSAFAQPAPTVKTLVNTRGTLTAGVVVFSNFQTPATLPFPHPQGALPNDGADMQVTAITTADGRAGLTFTFIDPVTGTPKPLLIDAANGPADLVRNVTFDVTAASPQRLLHTIDASFGPGTSAAGDAHIASQNYYVEPGTGAAGLLISDTLVSGNLTRGGVFVPEGGSLLPGGNLASFRFGNEFEFISSHHGGVRSGIAQADSFTMIFSLVPFTTPDPPVTVNPVFVGANATLGGTTGNGFVTLSNPAQAGGANVMLSSNDPATASVPASINVPQGAKTGLFPITTSPVTAPGTTVGLTATTNGQTVSGFVQIFPAPPLAVQAITISPTAVVGGSPIQGIVTMTVPPSDPVQVALTSSNPAIASVPATVTMPAEAVSADFSITTSPVNAASIVSVSASFNGGAASASALVNPVPSAPTPVFTLQVGTSNKGTVTASPSGNDRAINCGNTCSAKFNTGVSITLTATPPAGKSFVTWANDCAAAGSGPVCTVTITRNTSVQAVFSK